MEFNVIWIYLEIIGSLFWGIYLEDNLDIKVVCVILNDEYYGLEEVKDCILEFFSIVIKWGVVSGFIVCFVGFLGVGKIFIGKFVVYVLNWEFFCFFVGGMCDEVEIKGYCWIYIGVMLGKFI